MRIGSTHFSAEKNQSLLLLDLHLEKHITRILTEGKRGVREVFCKHLMEKQCSYVTQVTSRKAVHIDRTNKGNAQRKGAI